MKTRREFVAAAIPLVVAGTAYADEPAKQTINQNGLDSAKTKADLKASLPFADPWKEASFKNRQYLFALVNWPTDSASYIDLHGWIYNKHFQEWRRICLVKTRNLGHVNLTIDETRGVISLRGAAGGELDKQEIFRFDLRATDDDAG